MQFHSYDCEVTKIEKKIDYPMKNIQILEIVIQVFFTVILRL